MNEAAVYEFGDVQFDVGRMVVSRAGQAIDLEPKAVDVLRFLIEHRDRLVTKDELLDAVWRDTFVTPNVLTRAVAQLRKGIGDDAHESTYIETVAKRGYRWIAPLKGHVEASALHESAGVGESPLPQPERRAIPYPLIAMAAVVVLVVGIASYVALRGVRSSAPPASPGTFPAVRRIIGGGSGYFVHPTLSPDGRGIAYTSDKTGALEIYVSGLVPGSREVALTSDGGQNMQPTWSPDGQWIAFHSAGRGGVWIVAAAGGPPRQVVEFGSRPAWSPDSQWLAFESDEGSMAAQSAIWIVRRDGSDRRQVTRLGSPAGGHHMPSWSHDGRHIVFGNAIGGTSSGLWIVDPERGTPTQLTDGMAGGNVGGTPEFASDDRAIYFAGFAAGGNGRIYRLAIDHDTFEPLGAPQPVLAYEDALSEGLSIARDGTAVYGLFQEDSNLWAVDWPVPGEPVRLTEGKRNFRAAYSPSGRVVYMNQEVGQGFTIWLMAADGSAREPLVPDLQGFQPQWSPDGSRVLIRKSGELNDSSFAWVDLATRRVTPFAFAGGGMNEVRLSPSGRDVVFYVIGEDGALNLWRQPLAGGPRRQITFDKEAISYAMWSPDGRSIAAEVKRGSDTNVVVVPADGGGMEQLTFEHGQSWPNAWSPDGEWIAFAGERASVWNVYAVSRATHETRQLTHFKSSIGYVRWPTWSPDGHRIIFERNQVQSAIWQAKLP